MAAYSWQALDRNGHLKKGVWDADSPKHLRQKLRAEGLNPVALDDASGTRKAGKQNAPARGRSHSGVDRRLKASELSMFTRQLATLMRARLPVEEALGVLVRQSAKNWQRNLFTAIRSRVTEGVSLADAFRHFPKAFPEYFAATVAAGEQSGSLELVLERLAEYAEEANTTRQKVLLSLLYPVVVSIVALIVVIVLMVYVVPKMVSVFQHMDQQLPTLTRGLIALSDFLQAYGPYLLAAVVLGSVLFGLGYRRDTFKEKVHRLLLKVPLVSGIIRELNTGRFLRTYGILLGSSVSAPHGMQIGAKVLGNLEIQKAIMTAAERVREGASISSALTATGYFSPMALNLVSSGEASGNLPEMLERAGEGQEKTLQTAIATVVGVLEPLMIVLMGAVVLVIVLAILMPIFEMNKMV